MERIDEVRADLSAAASEVDSSTHTRPWMHVRQNLGKRIVYALNDARTVRIVITSRASNRDGWLKALKKIIDNGIAMIAWDTVQDASYAYPNTSDRELRIFVMTDSEVGAFHYLRRDVSPKKEYVFLSSEGDNPEELVKDVVSKWLFGENWK